MVVNALRFLTCAEIRAATDGFAARYVADWILWLQTGERGRPQLFGEILRRWQATRPVPMRRIRAEASHEAPFLEDLVRDGALAGLAVGDLDLRTIRSRSLPQQRALETMWSLFAKLTSTNEASCVGITKAILLMTDGRIGPAFDSQVRDATGILKPSSSREWLWALDDISDDLRAFEAANDRIETCVAPQHRSLRVGRLYDMAVGPR